MELTTAQIYGIIISIIVIALLIYWLISKIKTKRNTYSFIERDKKKASKFTQGIINDVDKVLSELGLSSLKDNEEPQFLRYDARLVRYTDINLEIETDAWYIGVVNYNKEKITILYGEINRRKKIKKFFLSTINQEVMINKVA